MLPEIMMELWGVRLMSLGTGWGPRAPAGGERGKADGGGPGGSGIAILGPNGPETGLATLGGGGRGVDARGGGGVSGGAGAAVPTLRAPTGRSALRASIMGSSTDTRWF